VTDLTRPNGIAFSPDEKTLYVSNSDDSRKIWMQYDVAANGTVSNGRVFFDATQDNDGGVPDGMKLDVHGNIWATGPSAVYVFSPEGTLLGTIKPPEDPANCGWGDDGRTLYITAETSLYRIRTAVMGQRLVYGN
jgi:gluconolactonase